MKKITILSAKNYAEPEKHNYGDCILIDTGDQLFIYDCGSTEHANRAIEYMDLNDYEKATVILSHNDSDHFNGIPELINQNRIKKIYTTLLFKYVDEILDLIDDNRRNRESVKNAITDKYDNISQLSGETIVDIYEEPLDIPGKIKIVGPDKDYMLSTVAKNLDGREGNNTDNETNVNATSIQVKVNIASHTVLLDGDCSFAAIKDKLDDYDVIQLPHHGKAEQAEEIFDAKENEINTYYIVSDNTGGSNGGSDDLVEKGHKIFNTKNSNDICIDSTFFSVNRTKMTGSWSK